MRLFIVGALAFGSSIALANPPTQCPPQLSGTFQTKQTYLTVRESRQPAGYFVTVRAGNRIRESFHSAGRGDAYCFEHASADGTNRPVLTLVYPANDGSPFMVYLAPSDDGQTLGIALSGGQSWEFAHRLQTEDYGISMTNKDEEKYWQWDTSDVPEWLSTDFTGIIPKF